MSTGYHYELQAYICGVGCVKPSPFEGWATFAQIFNNRPSGCRYAVVRRVPLRNHQGKVFNAPRADGPYMVWDLYHDDVVKHQRHKAATLLLRPPTPTWSGYSRYGMIMKAMMPYDREG